MTTNTTRRFNLWPLITLTAGILIGLLLCKSCTPALLQPQQANVDSLMAVHVSDSIALVASHRLTDSVNSLRLQERVQAQEQRRKDEAEADTRAAGAKFQIAKLNTSLEGKDSIACCIAGKELARQVDSAFPLLAHYKAINDSLERINADLTNNSESAKVRDRAALVKIQSTAGQLLGQLSAANHFLDMTTRKLNDEQRKRLGLGFGIGYGIGKGGLTPVVSVNLQYNILKFKL